MRRPAKTKVRVPEPGQKELGEFLRGWVQAASIRGVKPREHTEAFDRGWDAGCRAFVAATAAERERLGLPVDPAEMKHG